MILYYTSIRLKITFGPNVCQATVHSSQCIIICMCVEKPHDKCVCYDSAKSTVKNMVHIITGVEQLDVDLRLCPVRCVLDIVVI